MLNLIGTLIVIVGLVTALQGFGERDSIKFVVGSLLIIVGCWLATGLSMDTGPTGQAWG